MEKLNQHVANSLQKLNKKLHPGKTAISLAHKGQLEVTQFNNRRFHPERKGAPFNVKLSFHLLDFKDTKFRLGLLPDLRGKKRKA